jgi:hypothetical protein
MRGWRRAWLASGAILLAACGGHTAAKRPVERGEAIEAAEASDTPTASEDDRTEARPAAEMCADDTCFRCGKGFCMAGFFCDEDAAGGAACSWLPGCPARASCDCVERVLGSACRCEEAGGQVSVSCG